MTAFPSYSTGTVSVVAGGTVIEGAGAIWSGVNARAGDDIVIGGHTVIVEDVIDPLHLAIDAWPYADIPAGTVYKIVQRSPLRFAGGQAMADVSALIAALNTEGVFVVVGPTVTAPDPSLGEENQFAFQPGGGNLWQKTGGAWVLIGNYKGFGTLGAWNADAAYSPRDIQTFNGSAYVALTENTNKQPDANPSDWLLFAAKGQDGAVYTSASTSSVAIGTGSKVFAIVASRGYTVGQRVRVASDVANYMEGPVASYVDTTLTITVDHVSGSGTFASWTINIAGDVGGKGDKGDQGSPGSTYGGTSTTSVAIGTGSKTFAIQTGLAYQAGARVRISSGANYVEGVVTAYDSGTGSLTLNVDKTAGSGTFASWTVNVAGEPGSPLGQKQDYIFEASAGQTTFSGPDKNSNSLVYTAGNIEVYYNGLALRYDTYTATDGISIVFPSALNDGDVVAVLAFAAFNPADALSKSANGGDITDKPAFRATIGAAASPATRTRTVLTGGSGTYTTPAGCKAINVRMVGGGGGGGGGGPSSAFGSVGGDTTFGTSLLTASGGANGGPYGNAHAAGGNATGGDINIKGGDSFVTDGAGGSTGAVLQGKNGGSSAFGGAGHGGWNGSAAGAGTPNSGGGGGGGGGTDGSGHGRAATGGAAGGYVEKLIVNPSATYAYSVGAGGSGGTASGDGSVGGAGGSGVIIIDEFY